jgi:hypothetical protein
LRWVEIEFIRSGWPISSEMHHPISRKCTTRFHESAPLVLDLRNFSRSVRDSE